MPESIGRSQVKVGLIAAAFVAVAVVVAVTLAPRRSEVVHLVEQFGVYAPAAGIVAYALFSVLLVPGSLLSVAAGYVFGPFIGTVVTVVGGLIGATLSFAVTRTVAREPVRRLTGDRRERFDAWLERHGAMTFAYVRLVPGVPYQLVNYVGGLTSVSTRQYIAGTALGLIPGGFAYAALGGTIDDPTSPGFIGAVLLLLTVLAVGPLLQRRLGPQEETDREGTPG